MYGKLPPEYMFIYRQCFILFAEFYVLKMVPLAEKEKVKALIRDTLTLLCKNGLPFSKTFSIEALIGITIDEDDILLLSVNELIRCESTDKELKRSEKKRVRRREAKRVLSVESDNDWESSGSEDLDPRLSEDDGSEHCIQPAKRMKSETNLPETQAGQELLSKNSTRNGGHGLEECTILTKVESKDLSGDSLNHADDIIIKQEVEDGAGWISANFESDANNSSLMLPATSDSSFQNPNLYQSQATFDPAQSRTGTSTVTSADQDASEIQVCMCTHHSCQLVNPTNQPSLFLDIYAYNS